jgi:predicted dehydrogenase
MIRVLVVGLGNMGRSHARAYASIGGFEIAGLCSLDILERPDLATEFPGVPLFEHYSEALAATAPDAVSINTWPDTHASYAKLALNAGCHVFMEKPIAENLKDAREVVALAKRKKRKLIIGYVLRVHPSWTRFVEIGRTLGKPLVMRMNLNQQSWGSSWRVHRHLMESLSPIVDCGVHYVDIMRLTTQSHAVRVHAIGARLTDELKPEMYNYGCLHVAFADGSVGWYEAGWGPMMSDAAHFVKDMIGPKGSVSFVMDERGLASDNETLVQANALKLHHAELATDGTFLHRDEIVRMDEEPGHQDLCNREQILFRDAILNDADLSEHYEDSVESLRVVLAADKSVRTGKAVRL